MAPLSLASFGVAALAYAAATVLFYWQVARGQHGKRLGLASALLALAALGHGAYVTQASFIAHVCPVHSLHFLLSMASLLATAAYLGARRRVRIEPLGLLVAPLGLVMALGTFLLGAAGPERRLPASFIALHVLASLAGFAMFLLACGAAIMYLVQERRLKAKKLSDGGLPALDALDHAVHRFLIAGFPLLTLTVVTGTVAKGFEHGSPEEVLRNLLSYATWLLFGAVLLLRVALGWRGRRAAYGTVAGFCCVLMVLFIYLVRGGAV